MDFGQFFSQDNFQAVIWPLIVEYVPKIMGLILALIAAKILSIWAGNIVFKSLHKAEDSLQKFLSSLTKYSVLTIGVVTALSYVGIQTASFAAVIAASGLAIGLAFQGTLSNFSAGVMLLIFKPFKIGDYVQVGGQEGFIVELEMFSTEIKTVDNKKVIIPNSSIFGSIIINFTHYDTRRVTVSVGTSYSADIDETRKTLESVASKIELAISDPAPQVFLASLGDSSVDWQVRVWCKTEDYWTLYQKLVREVKVTLDNAKISIPFPQQDVHIDESFLKKLK